MYARVYEHLAKCRKRPDQTDKMGQIGTPCTKLVRCPIEIGNRVGGVKLSRGFESHPLRFFPLFADRSPEPCPSRILRRRKQSIETVDLSPSATDL